MPLDFNVLSEKESIERLKKLEISFLNDMAQHEHLIAEEGRRTAKRNETLVAGAEASVAQKELLEQQLAVIQKQNELLLDNYEKLKELYDDQVQTNKDAKADLEKSRRYNGWMMAISVISMLAAVASPIITVLVS